MAEISKREARNIEKIREYLAECTVLLKRDGSFPLKEPCTIAAYGGGVRNTVKGGTGSGEVNSRYFVTVEQGLEDAGFFIVDTDWLDKYDEILKQEKERFIASIKAKAKAEKKNVIAASMGAVMREPDYDLPLKTEAEAAIYVLARISGEGNDRSSGQGDFRLTDTEIRDILYLNSKYRKFMLIINAGGPVDLSEVNEVRNILVLSQLGVETGRAVADILLGKANPSGKLATTWSTWRDYSTVGNFADRDETYYREGIYVGYRFFDAAGKKAMYPFGYGLSYSQFEWKYLEGKIEASSVTVSLEVTNTGKYAGKEVMQLYLSCPQGKLDREVKSLAGYGKTRLLQPQESQQLTIGFDLRDFAGYDKQTASYILEEGNYVVLAGNSSVDVKPVLAGKMEQPYVVRKVRNAFRDPQNGDWKPEKVFTYDIEGLPLFAIDMKDHETEVIEYHEQRPIDSRLDQLSDEQVALLNIGHFNEKGGALSIIGNAASKVAGAAGESCDHFIQAGIDSLIMADGPAGLRLAKQYYVDEKGAHAVGSAIPAGILEMMPKLVRWFMNRKPKVKKGTEIKQQFTTAIPIGTAIAQSWNEEFARVCGDIVGMEMEIFHVDLWLAPALNIHRSVLCGRNFEYYSEDPLISGNMAGTISRAVQNHKGCGVTLKHFAFNNQETNRYGSNSNISERAIREIYLKAFQIAIRKGQPEAVMSSYNLINGVHTSESRPLIHDILFDEFGFDGLVMTDWLVGGDWLSAGGKYGIPYSYNIAASGHSLMMPGSKKDYEELLKGMEKGRVSARQLRENATRLLKVIDRLHR